MADDASVRFNFLKGVDTASPHMDRVGDNAVRMAAKTSAAGALMQSRMVLLGGAIVVASSEVIAFADALAPVGGLLAAIPAVAFAGAASIGALALGFHGLAAAMKTSAGGAGPSASSIASAERRVASAQREATQAQLDVNQARQDAVRKLADLSQALELANLDQEESALSVKQAEDELAQARRSHDPARYAQAQISLRRAQINAEQSTIHLSDAQAEFNDAQQKGIEGSDQVQTALRKQADAVQNLKDAQDALAHAKSGGGGADAAAAAYAKLAPSAKQVVDALKALGPAWRQVQQATQQALFAGLGGDISKLGAAQLPGLKSGLAGVAAGFNTAFRQTTQLASTPEFVKDTNTALVNTAKFSQLAGRSLAPFVDGLRQLGVVGSTFLPRLGGWIREIAMGFDRWATGARESGRASQWINNGIVVAGKFGMLLRNVGTALRNIFHAGDAGPQFLDLLVKGSAAFAAWTASAEGQGQLHEFFTSLRDVASSLWDIIKSLAEAFVQSGPAISTVAAYFSIAGAVIKVVADNMDLIRPILPLLIIGFATWRIAMVNAKIAIGAVSLATKLMNLTFLASPIGLIIAAVVGLVAAFVLLWKKSEGFRDFIKGAWKDIQAAGEVAWVFLRDHVLNPLGKAFGAIGDGLQWAWDHTIQPILNFIQRHIDDIKKGLDALKPVSQQTFGPSAPGTPIGAAVTKQLPHLASGGMVLQSGAAVIHKGETVVPAGQVGRSPGGSSQPVKVELHINSGGSQLDNAIVQILRKAVKDRGGNVQFVLGGAR